MPAGMTRGYRFVDGTGRMFGASVARADGLVGVPDDDMALVTSPLHLLGRS